MASSIGDGKFYWDGERWVPLPATPQPIAQPIPSQVQAFPEPLPANQATPTKGHTLRNLALSCLGLIVLLVVIGNVVNGSRPTDSTPATSPLPDAGQYPNQPNAYVYNLVIQEDMPVLVSAAQGAQSGCSGGVLAKCRAGLVALKAAATRFQDDDVWLNGLPTCLEPVDLELTLALKGLVNG
jgi:hypothetical protein